MVDILLSQGKCGNQNVSTEEGINRSVHYVTGRFGEDGNRKLYGMKSLPLIHPDSKIAKLLLISAHEGSSLTPSHSGFMKTLATSRNRCFIYKGLPLAKKVCIECPQCIKDRAEICTQKMGLLSL